MADKFSEDYVVADVELQLPELRTRLEKINDQIQPGERALGVDQRAKLRQLVNNPCISARMNARALKIGLCKKLRCRKFELDRLERSFMHQAIGIQFVNNQGRRLILCRT